VQRHNQTDAVAAGAELDAWLAEAGKCGVPTMETLAAGLAKDGDSIRAALTRALEQRPNRKAGQPTETDQAPDVWSCQLQPAPPPRSADGKVHSN